MAQPSALGWLGAYCYQDIRGWLLREKPCTPEHCMLPVDSAGAGGRRRKRKPGVIDLTEGASPLTHAGFGGSCDAHASSGEHDLGGRRQFVDCHVDLTNQLLYFNGEDCLFSESCVSQTPLAAFTFSDFSFFLNPHGCWCWCWCWCWCQHQHQQ